MLTGRVPARDLSRSQSPVTGTSLDPGVRGLFHRHARCRERGTRPFASIGYSHAPDRTVGPLNLSASANRNPWSSGYDAEVRLGVRGPVLTHPTT